MCEERPPDDDPAAALDAMIAAWDADIDAEPHQPPTPLPDLAIRPAPPTA